MKKSVVHFFGVFLLILLFVSSGLAQQFNEPIQQINLAVKQKPSELEFSTVQAVYELVNKGDAKAREPQILDALVSTGANCLNDQAGWMDAKRGRIVYDTLKKVDGKLVTESLARKVIKGTNRLHVLFLGVKLGIPGSQERLNQILMNHGDKKMAEDFLNSGSQDLFEGGKKWANAHGYRINTGMGSHRVGWGRF
jgi:hypothetical protein